MCAAGMGDEELREAMCNVTQMEMQMDVIHKAVRQFVEWGLLTGPKAEGLLLESESGEGFRKNVRLVGWGL